MNYAEIAQHLPPLRQKIMVFALAVVAICWLIRMMRQHRLTEEHALLWFLGLAAALAVVWCDPLLLSITVLLGADVPASALLLLALFFMFLMSVWLTTVVSRHKRMIARLTIAVSILQAETGGDVLWSVQPPSSVGSSAGIPG